MPRLLCRTAALGILALIGPHSVAHQPGLNIASPEYQQPTAAIVDLLTASPPPTPLVHARSRQAALLYKEAVIDLSRIARPYLGLAAYRYDPASGISGVEPLVWQVELVALDAGKPSVQTWLPDKGARLDHLRFSPDGRYLSATLLAADKPAQLAIFDTTNGKTRRIKAPINAAWGKPCEWVEDDALVCRVHASTRAKKPVPHWAPVVIENRDGATPVRTYNNLLGNGYDDALFEHNFTTELARVTTRGKVTTMPNTRGMLRRFIPSADGSHAIVTRLHKPWSRQVAASKFPRSIEVWDLVNDTLLYTSAVSGFGVESDDDDEPRHIFWKPGANKTAGYILQDADSGHYQWRKLAAPFIDQPQIIASSEQAFHRVGWTTAGTPWYSTRSKDGTSTRVWIVGNEGPKQVWQGDAADRYSDPGQAITLDGQHGPVLEVDGQIFLAGDGLGPSGPAPFLDSYDFESGTVERLFMAAAGSYEQVLAVLDTEGPVLLTSRETETASPELFLINGEQRTPVRPQPSPYPELDKIVRRTIRYQRADGVALDATLYLPPDRVAGKPLPTLVWIYPYEFSERQFASQLDVRNFRYHKVKGPSPLAAALAGYAVVVNPTMPIVHADTGMNDTYIPQLVASAQAVVDHLVTSGVSDPNRLAVGGRSYGAFSAANLLVHSRLFATGIAMSGAYNRSLTPFGFQHEKRSFWQARDLYTDISPFFHVDDIEGSLLLVHGSEDPNPGTPPLQARRMFHALAGEGVDVRYVELPFEGHHYWAKESVLDAAAELINWLDRTIGPAGSNNH